MGNNLGRARKVVEHVRQQGLYEMAAAGKTKYHSFDFPSAVQVAIAEILLAIYQQNERMISLLERLGLSVE